MVQAYVLIQTDVGKAQQVASAIDGIEGVAQVDTVTGPYDVVVQAKTDSVDTLGSLVVNMVQGVPGITRTVTCSVIHL